MSSLWLDVKIIFTDSPDCLPILLSLSVFFYFLVFLYSIFLVFGSVLIKMTYVSFWVHVKIVSHVVSYCKVLILVLFKDFQFQLELCKTVTDFTKIKTSKQKW